MTEDKREESVYPDILWPCEVTGTKIHISKKVSEPLRKHFAELRGLILIDLNESKF